MDNNKKIVVRQAELRDAAALREIYAQPRAFAGTLQLPCPSERLWETRLAGNPDNLYAFVAELDGKVVGNLGLDACTNPRRRWLSMKNSASALKALHPSMPGATAATWMRTTWRGSGLPDIPEDRHAAAAAPPRAGLSFPYRSRRKKAT